MTMILTYDDIFSRVRITVTGAHVLADRIRVERSTDQINWTPVRGATNLPAVANSASVDDYEFSANITNYYRARGMYTGNPVYIAPPGAAVHANNASVVPPLPAGIVPGELLLVYAAFRARDFGVPNIPSGYNLLGDAGNVRLFGKIAVSGEVAPTVTFSASVANATCSAQMAHVRGLGASSMFSAIVTDTASSQDIPYPRVQKTFENRGLLFYLGWKADDWISVATLAGITEVGDSSSTLGDDQGIVWDVRPVVPGSINIPPGSFVVTGGAVARTVGAAVAVNGADQVMNTDLANILPTIDSVWLKDVFRPFLNRKLDCLPNQSSIGRRSRNGVFDIVGRSYPVAVTDLHSSREFAVEVITQTTSERHDFDLIMSTGDIFFIQAPPESPTPSTYVIINDTDERRPLRNRNCGNDWRVFTLPLVEVAKPSAEIAAVTGTWQTVINTYATWGDVMAAHATWASLLTVVGTVNEVLVP